MVIPARRNQLSAGSSNGGTSGGLSSADKGLLADDAVPCLLRPICSSAISVAAIALARRHVRARTRYPVCMPAAYARLHVSACILLGGWCARDTCVRPYAASTGRPLCFCLCMLSWLNSCSTETNYNEARLVGRESAMFSFLCPLRRPFSPCPRPRRIPLPSPVHPSVPSVPTTIRQRPCSGNRAPHTRCRHGIPFK